MNFQTGTTLSDTELLERLVAFDSTSPNSNLPIADFIADYLDRPGISIQRQPSPDGDKTNLIVTVGPTTDPDSRDGLTLSGHMDVVPADEPEWDSHPFSLTEKDGKLFGRGSCDMKGFVALAINAAVAAAARDLSHPLALVLTYDEEVGTLGARHFAASWPTDLPLPRRTIVGEPTSLQVVRLHKGHARMHLCVHGRRAHSGYPHLGHNAIEPAARAIVALSELRRRLESEDFPNQEHFPEVPFVPMNVGIIRGGVADNIVPDACHVELSFRVLPGMRPQEIIGRIRETVAQALAGESYDLEEVNQSPPMLLEEDADLYRTLCELIDQRQTISASYATDAGWLQERDLECLLFGPGDIGVAHRPNEFMPMDEFARGADLLRQTIDRCCG